MTLITHDLKDLKSVERESRCNVPLVNIMIPLSKEIQLKTEYRAMTKELLSFTNFCAPVR